MPFFFFSSRRRHTRWTGDWSSDVCSSDLIWNILMQSALSITSRHNGLLRIMQRDVTNRRLAIADCISGTSPDLLCKAHRNQGGAAGIREDYLTVKIAGLLVALPE